MASATALVAAPTVCVRPSARRLGGVRVQRARLAAASARVAAASASAAAGRRRRPRSGPWSRRLPRRARAAALSASFAAARAASAASPGVEGVGVGVLRVGLGAGRVGLLFGVPGVVAHGLGVAACLDRVVLLAGPRRLLRPLPAAGPSPRGRLGFRRLLVLGCLGPFGGGGLLLRLGRLLPRPPPRAARRARRRRPPSYPASAFTASGQLGLGGLLVLLGVVPVHLRGRPRPWPATRPSPRPS